MDYVAKINEIESELKELDVDVKSETGEMKNLLQQRILALERTRLLLYRHAHH